MSASGTSVLPPSPQETTATPKSKYDLLIRDIRRRQQNKARREMRARNPKKMRGGSAILKSVGGGCPAESENLCLFTCIVSHLYKCYRNDKIMKTLSRCSYVLYKMGIPFNKEKLQKAVKALSENPSVKRITTRTLLISYIYGEPQLIGGGERRALWENHSKNILRECVGHPLDDLISVEIYFNLRIRLWLRGGPEIFYNGGDSDNDIEDHPPTTDPETTNRKKRMFAKCLVPSSRNSGEILDLSVNAEMTHVDLIQNLDLFGNQFICSKCDQNFSERRQLQIHEEKCATSSNVKYLGGVFNPRKSIFERLEENEISVPYDLQFVQYFIVYDFESLLVPISGRDESYNGPYEEHIPVSVGVGSNLDPETAAGYFLCNENPLQLIREFIELLLKLSDRIFDVVRPKYQTLFDRLEEKIITTTQEKNIKQVQILKRLHNDLHNVLRRAPVLSFNGSRYDVVLIMGYLFQIYREMGNFAEEKITPYKEGSLRSDVFVNILQRGSQIMSLVTQNLTFKDLALFLAPGCSYKKYLKNHSDDVEKLEKLIFPYKMAKSFDCLNSTKFPQFEDFWCDLRQRVGISGQQYSEFIKIWRDPVDHNVIKNGGTLMTILSDYNLADVSPLIRAITKHISVYKNELGVDLFFEYISLPSVGMKWMFKGEKEKFYTFPQEYGFLHRQIQKARTGGLCTVFKRKSVVGEEMRRYHEVGGSIIETPRICKAISFIDATSLYPAMFSLYQFYVGAPIYRRGPFFKPERVGLDHGVSAESHSWLRYCERKYDVRIISGHNDGEVSVSRRNYPVDGFAPPTKIGDRGMCFQYNGCYYHGHECEENNIASIVAASDLPPHEMGNRYNELRKEARLLMKHTIRKRDFLLSEGYDVVSIFSCQWAKQKKRKEVKDILIETGGEDCTLYPKSCLPNSGTTTPEIVSKVGNGEFHGLLKVDIFLEEPWATKYEFFPFFCQNQLVYRENLSPQMQNVCEANKALKRPSKQLVSVSNAKSLLVTSELLKWYLEHHAKVDFVHWCLEYKRAYVFKDKIEKMVEWRRASIYDKNKTAQANSAKLLANSTVGKTGEDISRHKNTKICGVSQVHKYVDCKKFVDAVPIPTPKNAARSAIFLNQREAFRDILKETDELDFDMADLFTEDDEQNQLYLVEIDKNRHVFKNPSTIQLVVYNHAKLHMLTMAIDILMFYPIEGTVSIIYTDTDSFGLELAFDSLDLCIDPEKRLHYFSNVRHKWFPREWCGDHFEKYVKCKVEGGEWDFKACSECHEVYRKEFFTPGIFKVEQNGDHFIALSPKMYVLENSKTGEVKSGSKGVSQRCNNLTYDLLHEQLTSNQDLASGTKNYQFSRNKVGGVSTSQLEKFSISKLYCKRRLMTDNINTLPLLRKKIGNYDVVHRAYIDDDDTQDRPNLCETVFRMVENEIIQIELDAAVNKCAKAQDHTPPP